MKEVILHENEFWLKVNKNFENNKKYKIIAETTNEICVETGSYYTHWILKDDTMEFIN